MRTAIYRLSILAGMAMLLIAGALFAGGGGPAVNAQAQLDQFLTGVTTDAECQALTGGANLSALPQQSFRPTQTNLGRVDLCIAAQVIIGGPARSQAPLQPAVATVTLTVHSGTIGAVGPAIGTFPAVELLTTGLPTFVPFSLPLGSEIPTTPGQDYVLEATAATNSGIEVSWAGTCDACGDLYPNGASNLPLSATDFAFKTFAEPPTPTPTSTNTAVPTATLTPVSFTATPTNTAVPTVTSTPPPTATVLAPTATATSAGGGGAGVRLPRTGTPAGASPDMDRAALLFAIGGGLLALAGAGGLTIRRRRRE